MKLNRAPQLKDQVFVFAGHLERIQRSRAARVLESRGAVVRQALSGKTDYLVVGREPGAQLDKARARGVTILPEAQFIDLLMGRPPRPEPRRPAPTPRRPATNEALTALRQLAYEEPSAQVWGQVCALLERCGGAELALALDYLRGLLARWPSPEGDPSRFDRGLPGGDLRQAPARWVTELLAGQASPALQLARALSCARQGLTGAVASPLARCPHLGSLEELDLSGNPLSASFLHELANSEHLARLQRLNLSGVSCGPQAIKALQSGPAMARLTHLNLSEAQLGPRRALAALEAPGGWPSLRWLHLGDNQLAQHEGVRTLAALEALEHLQSLDLSGNGLVGGSLSWLLRQRTLTQAEHLHLSRNRLDHQDAQALAQHGWSQPPQTLRLDSNPLRAMGARALASAPWLRHLQRLSLIQTGLGDDGARALIELKHLPGLTHLGLGCNDLQDHTAAALLERPWAGQLRGLHLAGNPLGASFARALVDARHLRLESLDLRHTQIDADAALALLQAPHLRHLPDLRLPLVDYDRATLEAITAQDDLPEPLRRRCRELLRER